MFFVRYVEEIYGGEGSDTLSCGDGNDIILGENGYLIRRYSSEDGRPLLTTKIENTASLSVWRKDIVLEEVGNITGVHTISSRLNTVKLLAEDFVSSSFAFIANAFRPSGEKYTADNTPCSEWPSDLFLFSAMLPSNDTLNGDGGDDVLIGQRGDGKNLIVLEHCSLENLFLCLISNVFSLL